jgi:hypothetical protein
VVRPVIKAKAGIADLELVKGDDFTQVWVYKDSDGDGIDLTGYTAEFTLKASTGNTVDGTNQTFTHAPSVDSSGNITFNITDVESSAWTFSTCLWYLRLDPPGTGIEAETIARGKATLLTD